MHNATDEPFTEEEQVELEYWWDSFIHDRIRVRDDPKFPDKVANMKWALRELVAEDPEEYGILSLYEKYCEPSQSQVATCWFVISAVKSDDSDIDP